MTKDREKLRAKRARYREKHRERLNKAKREKKRTGKPSGRSRVGGRLPGEDAATAFRRREGVRSVARTWLWERCRRSCVEVVAELSSAAYVEWFDALDGDELEL